METERRVRPVETPAPSQRAATDVPAQAAVPVLSVAGLQGNFTYTNNIELSRKDGKGEAQVTPGSLTVGAIW